MKTIALNFIFLFISLCFANAEGSSEARTDANTGESAVIQEIMGIVGHNEGQIISLAEAIPDNKFGWRPGEGVRSVSEVLMHTASANFFFLSTMGFQLPEGVNPQELESITDKNTVVETVKSSFAFIKENAPKIDPASLSDKVTTPFGEFTKLGMLLILLDHSGEHKGQLIAYARTNGITPPWSEK